MANVVSVIFSTIGGSGGIDIGSVRNVAVDAVEKVRFCAASSQGLKRTKKHKMRQMRHKRQTHTILFKP